MMANHGSQQSLAHQSYCKPIRKALWQSRECHEDSNLPLIHVRAHFTNLRRILPALRHSIAQCSSVFQVWTNPKPFLTEDWRAAASARQATGPGSDSVTDADLWIEVFLVGDLGRRIQCSSLGHPRFVVKNTAFIWLTSRVDSNTCQRPTALTRRGHSHAHTDLLESLEKVKGDM